MRLAQIFLNSVLVVAFMLTAFGPRIASAQPINAGTSFAEPYSGSIEKYRYPMDLGQPGRTSPEPDVPSSEIPAKPQKPDIEFSISATPNVINKGDKITLTVTVQNHSSHDLTGLEYQDKLDDGLAFISTSSDVVSFDQKKQEIIYIVNGLGSGKQLSFNYSVQVTVLNSSKINGEVWLHSIDLTADKGIHLKAQTSFGVGTALPKMGTSLVPENSQGSWHSLGNFSIYLDQGSVKKNSLLTVTPDRIDPKGPPLQVKLSVLGTDPILQDLQGNAVNQRVGLQNLLDTTFAKPAFLEIKLDGIADLKHIPAGKEPFVATYDEVHKIWVKVPILGTDSESNFYHGESGPFLGLGIWNRGFPAAKWHRGSAIRSTLYQSIHRLFQIWPSDLDACRQSGNGSQSFPFVLQRHGGWGPGGRAGSLGWGGLEHG